MAYGRRGVGFGRSIGWRQAGGYRPWGYQTAPISKKDEAEMLKEDASCLEEELGAVKARLSQLESQK